MWLRRGLRCNVSCLLFSFFVRESAESQTMLLKKVGKQVNQGSLVSIRNSRIEAMWR